MRGKYILLFAGAVIVIAVVAAIPAYIRHGEADLMEHKTARTTTGVVVDKKYVQFRDDQTSYQDEEGRTIPVEAWRRQSGEYRIFYKIDNFDQIPEAHREALVTAEKQRNNQHGVRFRIVEKPTYNEAKIGQGVSVTYRWADDSKIEVISIDLSGKHREGNL